MPVTTTGRIEGDDFFRHLWHPLELESRIDVRYCNYYDLARRRPGSVRRRSSSNAVHRAGGRRHPVSQVVFLGLKGSIGCFACYVVTWKLVRERASTNLIFRILR